LLEKEYFAVRPPPKLTALLEWRIASMGPAVDIAGIVAVPLGDVRVGSLRDVSGQGQRRDERPDLGLALFVDVRHQHGKEASAGLHRVALLAQLAQVGVTIEQFLRH
jgi:hypothetical protein